MPRFASFIASLLFVVTPLLAARPAVPTLTAEDDQGNIALELSALAIRVTMRGHLVRTECELTFRNAMDRVVGGNFHFPLPADAEVSDLGLYFDDHLRHAVAVERVLARTAYEEVVHRGVDPALVEWSSGRGFDLEVYPIPAKGEKKVFIAYDQELTASDYLLDLRYARTIGTFELTLDTDGRNADIEGNVPRGRASNALLDGVVRIARDPSPTAFAVQSRKDATWYATATLDVTPARSDAAPAPHVVIFYDTSSSSIQQDAARLRQFLGDFLGRQQAWATAELIPFHVKIDEGRRIDKIGTPAGLRELERELSELRPLGATNLIEVATELRALIDSLPPATRVVLVTDGLTSLGDSRDVAAAFTRLAATRRPLTIVNASPTADDHLLGNAARASGGWWLDLTQLDPSAAAEAAMRVPARIRNGDEILPAAIVASTASRHAIASRSKQPIVSLKDVPLRVLESEREVDLVRRAWARAKLRELMANGAADEELIAHGRAFTQLTPRTSLLVLETWPDYERYGIELPPDLAAAKAQQEQQQRAIVRARELPPSVVTSDGWFVQGRVLDDSGQPLPGVTVILMSGSAPVAAAVTNENGRYVVGVQTQPSDARLVAHLEGFGQRDWKVNDDVARGTPFELVLRIAAVTESITVTAAAPVMETMATATSSATRNTSLRRDGAITTDDLLASIATDAGTISDDPEVRAQVAKQRRVLTREVVAKLRTMRTSRERLRYYLSARALLGGDKSFHVLSAQAFRETSPELAARVLSDLAEARTDDAPLLRILARVLAGWDEPELAELLLRRALEISPGEPQTWRELILLEARRGRPAELTRWVKRMQAVKQQDVWGMKDLYTITDEAVARFRGASFADQRRGLDVRADAGADVTVEAMYDTGWSWVDLHVAEPSGEVASWEHHETAAGGQLTGGYIFGYGPQTYSIAHAPRGTYRIAMDYYSEDPTKVSLESLVHLIISVRTRGGIERSDHFLVLSGEEQKLEVATVTVD